MAKHATRAAGTNLGVVGWPGRLRVGAAAAVLLALVSGGLAWALGGDDPEPVSLPMLPPPSVVLNPPSPSAPGAATGGVPGPSADPTRVVAPPPTATTRRTGGPRTAAAATPTPSRKAAPPPATGLTAQYILGSAWDSGFVAGVLVRNPTGSSLGFEVRLSYPASSQVRVRNVWNATLSSEDGILIFTGGPIRQHGEMLIGFEATKAANAKTDPTSCTVVAVTG